MTVLNLAKESTDYKQRHHENQVFSHSNYLLPMFV